MGNAAKILGFGDVTALGWPETKKLPLANHMPDISGFDLVLTHNEAGEYGHGHHIQINQWVTDNYDGEIVTFCGKHEAPMTGALTRRWNKAIRCYNHISPSDNGKPKWKALLDRYSDVPYMSYSTL